MSIKVKALRYFFKLIGKANVERLRKNISLVYAVIENFNYDASTNGEHWLLLNLIAGRCSAYMDVGANVGEYSIFIAKNSRHIDNLSIISVEPSPYTFDLLMSNVEPFDSIKPFNLALSDANGAKVFYEHDDGSGRNTLEGETTGIKYKKSYNLEVKTAHDFLMENQITPKFDLVKIDVEGHELKVISGLESLLSSKNIGIVQFERASAGGTPKIKEFFDLFQRYGYLLAKLYPDYCEIYPNYSYTLEERIGCNWLAIDESSPAFKCIEKCSIRIESPPRVI